jgi:hypothetical protein
VSQDSSDNGRLLIRLDERTKRIEGKLDAVCQQYEKKYDDHEARLRDLEKAGRTGTYADIGAYLTGIAAGITAVLAGKQ